MTIVPAAWASVGEVARRVEAFRSKYAGHPLVDRIEDEITEDVGLHSYLNFVSQS
jgi:hypothetical protein